MHRRSSSIPTGSFCIFRLCTLFSVGSRHFPTDPYGALPVPSSLVKTLCPVIFSLSRSVLLFHFFKPIFGLVIFSTKFQQNLNATTAIGRHPYFEKFLKKKIKIKTKRARHSYNNLKTRETCLAGKTNLPVVVRAESQKIAV